MVRELGLSALAVAVVSCSSPDTGPTPITLLEAGAKDQASPPQDSGGGGDSGGGAVVNNCTASDYVDSPTTITWNLSLAPRCVHVKPGGTVTWSGDFSVHPLEAFNGDAPNPITSSGATGNSVTITFPNAGVYGFHCTVHPSMLGAIKVQ